jgi:hypothetical protein
VQISEEIIDRTPFNLIEPDFVDPICKQGKKEREKKN